MKTATLLLVLAFCLFAAGCGGPTEEVKAYVDAKEDLILQISKKIEASPNEAGVDEARKLFEARKADLRAQQDDVYEKLGGKHGDLLTMMLDSAANDPKMFDAIRMKLAADCQGSECLPAQEKLSALERDFMAALHK